MIAGSLAFGALLVVDRIAGRYDLGYEATRSRPNSDRYLTRSEFSVRVKTNALGFREPQLPTPKGPATARIVVIGDSFTQGYGVNEEESYPRVLDSLLRERHASQRHEVVNLGVPGTNPLDYLGNLQSVGLEYAPDVVVIGLMANDVQDVRTGLEHRVRHGSDVLGIVRSEISSPRTIWKRAGSAAFPTLYSLLWRAWQSVPARNAALANEDEKGDDPGQPSPTIDQRRSRDVLLGFAARFGNLAVAESRLPMLSAREVAEMQPVLTGALPVDSPAGAEAYMLLLGVTRPRIFVEAVLLPSSYDAAWERTVAILQTIDETARAAGARTLVVFIPSAHQVTSVGRAYLESRRFEWDDRTLVDTTFSSRLRAFGEQSEIEILDLLPVLRARAGEPLYFAEDGHWTAHGHRVAAEAIAGALSSPSNVESSTRISACCS